MPTFRVLFYAESLIEAENEEEAVYIAKERKVSSIEVIDVEEV